LRLEEAVPTPESQWADQVVVIRRKAAVDAAGDGFAEASCKNLKTGEVKAAAIGVPTEPAGGAGAPAVGDPEADK
jgi:hypothetical protein